MLNIFRGIFDSSFTSVISVGAFLLCVFCSLLCGLILAWAYTYKNHCSKSFILALALLPAVVCIVIMMVNGNVGTGVAVAGAFSLVRFRSVPGTAREIIAIFLAMAAGLILGMGYIAYGFLFSLLLGAVSILYARLNLGLFRRGDLDRTLRVTIPEDINYTDVFSDIFADHTSACELVSVKTTNMGSLFRLTYHLTLLDASTEKEMLDKLRCRNGNLEVMISRQEAASTTL